MCSNSLSRLDRLTARLRELYEGDSKEAARFRYGLLAIDSITILFLIISTFFYGHPVVLALDVLFGVYILLDFLARFLISHHKVKFWFNILNLVDVLVMLSLLLAPLVGEGFAFLRAVRILRLLRSYRVLARLRRDIDFFKQYEDVIIRSVHMLIFLFLMTELVFVTQVRINEHIVDFIDALYFTVATLTTTGFGDIVLHGPFGKPLSIVIMVFGVSLFLRLIKAIFRPNKVRYVCTDCGLFLHENDAIHCKHCGRVLNIPSDGDP